MSRPIPVPVLRTLIRLWERGQTPGQIAEALALPRATVNRLIGRFRERGAAGLETDYHRVSDPAASGLVNAVLRYRREHPTWGAELIRIHILEETWNEPVPSTRTLQRWLLRADLAPAPAGRPAKGNPPRATMPHETWQMDAKELIRIKNGELVSWLRFVDECSGAVLRTAVFPPRGRWNQVPPAEVREQLRLAFSRWGLPGNIRVDNGSPWGSKGDFPTELALWMIRLGIEMIWNTPSRPQENGVVERSRGRATAGASPGPARRPRNCGPAWSGWTSSTARSTLTESV